MVSNSLSGLQPFPHPAGAYGIAYNSLVATSEGKLWSLGGTYDNSRDMTQIYELDCSADIGAKYLSFFLLVFPQNERKIY